MRSLIINADDFGLCEEINLGIIDAHDHGVVTSASLMVLRPAAHYASRLATERPRLSVGLHADLGEWEFRDGRWVATDLPVALDDATAVARELDRQIDIFRALLGRDPTHLDSHQNVHFKEPVFSEMVRRAQSLHIPLRGVSIDVHHCRSFYARDSKNAPLPDAITTDTLIELFKKLPPGVSELSCHPARPMMATTGYDSERHDELLTLLDPRVKQAILSEQIHLRSYRNLYWPESEQ